MKRHKITKVDEGGIAEELGIEEGDFLLAINDKEIEDIFDYDFIVNDEYLEVLIEKANGEEWLLEVEKDYDEDLGMEFGESLMDEYRSCFNKCVFCFIDQNPPGMRETIYFKDDDTRLSFLQGNYVTLTNMKEKDIRQSTSPCIRRTRSSGVRCCTTGSPGRSWTISRCSTMQIFR